MAGLQETLGRQLMFPLPRSDEIRTDEEPIIPRTHPIHDYYAAGNWQGAVAPGGSVSRVIIAPTTISVPWAGLFTAFNQTARARLKTAVQTNLSGTASTWVNLSTTDGIEQVQEKLRAFVRGVAVSYTRETTGEADFDITADTTPSGFEVFAPAASAEGTATTADQAKAFQRSTSAYSKLKADHGDAKADQMFDSLRLYYAYEMLDTLFTDPDEYFFIKRLLSATRLIYVAQLMRMAEQNDKFDQVLGWMYHNTVEYASVDPTTNALETKHDADGNPIPVGTEHDYALDDMFRRNVELSHEVKTASATLLETKEQVSSARDNLQSLANSDDLVKTQQFNSKIVYFVVIGMMALQVLGLIAAEYMQAPLVGYLIIVLFAVVVLTIEATKGLNSLVNL